MKTSPCISRRRAMLGIASAASLTATARIASPAGAASLEPDPIFAAIEEHKAAYLVSLEKGKIRSDTVDAEWSPDYDPVVCKAAEEADDAATDAADDAANALTTIRPTTIAGILALLHHVEAFNAGAFALADYGSSAPMHWPADVDEDEIDLFGYSILANVRSALEAMAVRS